MNKFKYVSSRSSKTKKIDVNDQEYSKICSFTNKCDIECSIKKEELLELDSIKKNSELLSKKTYTENNITELIKPICKIISEFYEIYNYYTLNEIIDKVNGLTDTSEIIIYHSLNHMVEDKVIVWNKNEIFGTLVNINKYYIFQPIKNSDITLPLSEN